MAVRGEGPDRVSGSVDLFDAAAGAIRDHLVRRGTAEFGELLDALAAGHPSMALRLNLVAALRDRLPEGRERLMGALEEFVAAVVEARVAVASEFAALVHARGWKAVATYSRSGQVREALAVARKAGLERVLLSEGRPAGEGVLFAAELLGEGLAVELSADASLPGRLPRVQALVVGADACFAEGFANKVGTTPLLREARRVGIETVALTLPQKMLGGADSSPWKNIPMPPPREARKMRRGIAWTGDLFEIVPWDLASVVLGRE